MIVTDDILSEIAGRIQDHQDVINNRAMKTSIDSLNLMHDEAVRIDELQSLYTYYKTETDKAMAEYQKSLEDDKKAAGMQANG